MTISVIVPVYQIEAYLPECIESIMNQTYRDLEIILVDDGSQDGCPQICDQYRAADDRIRVIHKKNGGLVSARQAGLELSTGELIGYVDGDDWIAPDFYQNLYNAFCESGADIIADGFSRDIEDVSERMDNNIACGVYRKPELEARIYPRIFCAGRYFYFGVYSYVWNKLFKREILYGHQMRVDRRISVGEDIACTFPAILEADSIHIIQACAYHYRQRAGSMLKEMENYNVESRKLDVLESFLRDCFARSGYGRIMLPQLERYMTGIRLMRTGRAKGELFFARKISERDRVAIFSAGTFGQNLYGQLRSLIGCDIAGWYDADYRQYNEQGLAVFPIEDIRAGEFDKICIASLDERFIQNTMRILGQKGIPRESVLTVEEAYAESAVQKYHL